MKKLILYIILLFSFELTFSQEDDSEPMDSANYLIENPKIHISGFGGIIAETGTLDGHFLENLGAAGALSINHCFFIGGYGISTISKHTYNGLVLDNGLDSVYYGKSLRMNFSHSGIYTGVIFFPKKNVHLGINLKLGWGNIHLSDSINNSYYKNNNAKLEATYDKVFVLTPQIDAEFALADWIKCVLGVGYRYVANVGEGDFADFKKYNFNSPLISIGLFFGGFYEKEPKAEIIQNEEQE